MTSDLSELSHMSESIKADINNVCLSNNYSCGSFYYVVLTGLGGGTGV